MLKSAALSLAVLTVMAGSAWAGDRYRYDAPPPTPAARYYGPVTNYYGPVTIYGASDAGAYPTQGQDYSAYGSGYATAPQWDANSYGAGYGSDGFSGGYGYGAAYPAYGYGNGYGYPPSNEGQRLDPWAGYNGGPGNGYW